MSSVLIVNACFKSLSRLYTGADLRFVIEGNKAPRSSTRRENRGGNGKGVSLPHWWRGLERRRVPPQKFFHKMKFKVASFVHEAGLFLAAAAGWPHLRLGGGQEFRMT